MSEGNVTKRQITDEEFESLLKSIESIYDNTVVPVFNEEWNELSWEQQVKAHHAFGRSNIEFNKKMMALTNKMFYYIMHP